MIGWLLILALALNPKEAEAWLNLGLLLYNQGDSAGALERFERDRKSVV